jgi:hypothetical protein
MTRNDVLKLFPDATDEQITNLLNKSGEEMAREKEKANQYKAKADKADELQTQLDEIQAGNMTELEKANSITKIFSNFSASFFLSSFSSSVKSISPKYVS